MVKLKIVILIVIHMTACSSNNVHDSKKFSTHGVNLSLPQENRILPKVDLNKNNSSDEYGPSLSNNPSENLASATKRIPVIGLILGPGLNRVMAHIQLLKSLRKKNIKINIISGIGMSSFIAALYANGIREDKIEWIFHKFFNETKQLIPYSSAWKSKGIKHLVDLYKWEPLESLDLFTLLPHLNVIDKRLNFVNKGRITNILIENLTLFSNNIKDDFSTLDIFNVEVFRKVGVDILIGVDVLGENIVVSNNSSKIGETFKQITKAITLHKSKLDLYIKMPTENMPLDSLYNLSFYVLKSLEHGQSASLKIKEKISLWQDNHNSKLE